MTIANRTRSVQSDKTLCMSDVAFADLRKSLEDALAFERGERSALHVTRILEVTRNCAACEVQDFDKFLGS
jgi:hypothetical protein